MVQELIRSSYDIDGTRVELLFDESANRFTVATRWVNLTHFNVPFNGDKWTRITLERASAAFEAICLNGATKEVARVAKQKAIAIDASFCVSSAGYEREVLRQTGKAIINIK